MSFEPLFDPLNDVQTYSHDLPLFNELGLEPFKTTVHKKIHVGTVTKEDGSYADIWMTGAPAQFWEFKVFDSSSGRLYEISTGSGSLSKYWPLVDEMLQNCFVVKRCCIVENHEEDGENLAERHIFALE
jgi:hypothetical protein